MCESGGDDRTPSITVRRLTSGEEEAMAEAIRRLKPEAGGLAVKAEACRSFLASEQNVCVVGTRSGEAVGYAIAHVIARVDRSAPMVLLYEVEVSPAHRRRGAGLALVDAVRNVAHSIGACKMWTLTDEENDAARRLYRGAGGIESGENLLIVWPEHRLAPSHWRPDA